MARIGETEQQIAERYGQPYETANGYVANHKTRMYDAKNYRIMVDFVDGKSACEDFMSKDRHAFSATETSTLVS